MDERNGVHKTNIEMQGMMGWRVGVTLGNWMAKRPNGKERMTGGARLAVPFSKTTKVLEAAQINPKLHLVVSSNVQ